MSFLYLNCYYRHSLISYSSSKEAKSRRPHSSHFTICSCFKEAFKSRKSIISKEVCFFSPSSPQIQIANYIVQTRSIINRTTQEEVTSSEVEKILAVRFVTRAKSTEMLDDPAAPLSSTTDSDTLKSSTPSSTTKDTSLLDNRQEQEEKEYYIKKKVFKLQIIM